MREEGDTLEVRWERQKMLWITRSEEDTSEVEDERGKRYLEVEDGRGRRCCGVRKRDKKKILQR